MIDGEVSLLLRSLDGFLPFTARGSRFASQTCMKKSKAGNQEEKNVTGFFGNSQIHENACVMRIERPAGRPYKSGELCSPPPTFPWPIVRDL